MRRYTRKRDPLDACPAEFTLALLQGKWTLRLIFLLLQRPCQFGELKRELQGISAEVLSNRLATLREHELVESRAGRDSSGARLTTHALTPKAHSLLPALEALAEWGAAELRGRGIHWSPPTLAPPPGSAEPHRLAPVVRKFLLEGNRGRSGSRKKRKDGSR